MRILLVENERKTAAFLKKGLIENGFAVDIIENGGEGLQMALHGDYDLIIVDVMLPGRDGWSIVSELRKAGKETLSLFLTDYSSTLDRAKGLDLGTDAYLGKPFAFSELMALIRSLLRRSPSRPSDVIQVGDLKIDTTRFKAYRGIHRLELSSKEFALLSFLARRAGEILPRTIISDKVWDVNFESETNVVDVHIRRLRAKVDDPFDTKMIHTIRGMGYMLKEDVK